MSESAHTIKNPKGMTEYFYSVITGHLTSPEEGQPERVGLLIGCRTTGECEGRLIEKLSNLNPYPDYQHIFEFLVPAKAPHLDENQIIWRSKISLHFSKLESVLEKSMDDAFDLLWDPFVIEPSGDSEKEIHDV